MKNILLAALLCIFPSITQATYNIKWKTDTTINNITVKSTFLLNKTQIKKIDQIYSKSKIIFSNNFKDIKYCALGPLEVRIISKNMLRSKRYFYLAKSTNFGRYFYKSRTLYVIYDMFGYPEYLAHELAHHFFDECKINFKDKEEEHIEAYEFQKLYKVKHELG